MFIPYSTDAPIYYFPFATIGLIVANIFVFVQIIAAGFVGVEPWLLQYGNGLHPAQWISSTFLHGGIGHLLGNMLFLWVFGLVVEGKLGWWRFLSVYLGISVVQGFLEQTIMLGYDGMVPGSLGASAVIYGVMAMAVVWAPRNEISCMLFVFFRPFVFEVPILGLATFYVCMQLAFIFIFSDGSSWLHMSGFIVGLPLGIVLLKSGIVDCEGWDIFRVLSNRAGISEDESESKKRSEEFVEKKRTADDKQLVAACTQLDEYLKNSNVQAALVLHAKMQSVGDGLTLQRSQLLRMIKVLHAAEKWKESAPYMADFLQQFPEGADPYRIKLAQICVMALNRPGKALELLKEANAKLLTEKQVTFAKRIAAKARQMQSEGVVELDDDGW